MTHPVKDLSVEQRLAVESLLGRAVSDDESVSVKALSPTLRPTEEDRKAAIKGLHRYFAQVDANRQQVSDEEEDSIINEAIQSVRPGYRPVG
jgi:hypothetical protein